MPTVLVVEDDQATRNLLIAALARVGVDVAGAIDGVHALEILDSASTPCRLVILDLLMPRMDGRQFLEQVSLRPASRPTVILITAAVGFEELPRGVDLVVKKPFDITALIATAVNILQLGPVPPLANRLRAEPDAPTGGG